MTKSLSNSAKRIQDFLNSKGCDFTVKELAESTRTAQEAADSIGCEVGQIAKSLVFKDAASGEAILVIASGSRRVDTGKIEIHSGLKLDKADGKFVKAQCGYAIGGVPPVGHDKPIRTFIDESLLSYDEIWAAAGTPFAVFALPSNQLAPLSNGTVLDCT